MRKSFALFAESVSTKPLDLRKASSALYPPIPLYRRLLRAHRRLPLEMRSLGDDYVKAGSEITGVCHLCPLFILLPEFRRHQKVTNPVHIMGFLTQWQTYLDALPQDPSARNFKKLDPTVFEKMSAEQLGQLYELMHATRDVWKPTAK
ncbi:hypothetical protein ID866_1982 [Astraeus odoratus]|nr:hypothetical protein ID866_1982 [Astraeus odoratus]